MVEKPILSLFFVYLNKWYCFSEPIRLLIKYESKVQKHVAQGKTLVEIHN